MENLYVTLYPGPKSLVNCQILNIHNNRIDARLSAELPRVDTVFATFWLPESTINCHVRMIAASEDPITGELRASFHPLDLSDDENRKIRAALHDLHPYVRLRAVS
ncbi:MAG: hypothetical protein KGN02_07540 [bacterium]|nr:hypothetical protein [bacterium]